MQKHIWEGSIWSIDHWTTEEDVQGLIEESFPIVGTYRKDEPARTGEAAWTGEVVWNREAVWIGEGHFIFNRKVGHPSFSPESSLHFFFSTPGLGFQVSGLGFQVSVFRFQCFLHLTPET